jgi:hypothetical protein
MRRAAASGTRPAGERRPRRSRGRQGDPEGSNRVGLIVDVPDMAVFEGLMQSEAGAYAMKFDGVRPETMLILTEG